jgi:glycosyltransferase involved in cell wall biosynthesis
LRLSNGLSAQLLNRADVIRPSGFFDPFVGRRNPEIRFSDYGMKVPSAPERVPESANGRLRFSFIGSIMPHKGVDVLVDAFSRVSGRDAELRVYGDPGYAPDYYANVVGRARNGSVRFMGKFDNDDVYRILQETDALVVPSVWCENSPLTMHEAVLAGVPVIASNIGGMAELVRRTGNGLLFEVASVDDLHAKIDSLIAERGRLTAREVSGSSECRTTRNRRAICRACGGVRR